MRRDGSVLITAVLQRELWCVPNPGLGAEVPPVLVHTFEHPVTGIVEVDPDVFIVSVTEGYTSHESHLARVDLTHWTAGDPVAPEIIFTFDDRVRALNGSCLLGPGVMLAADCFAGFIWRIDPSENARRATARSADPRGIRLLLRSEGRDRGRKRSTPRRACPPRHLGHRR